MSEASLGAQAATGNTSEPQNQTGHTRPGSLRLLLNNRLAALGLLILLAVLVTAFAAPWLPLPDPDATDPANRLLRPLAQGHLLGTDALGRDLLARLIWGTRTSLAVGVGASLIAALAGSLIGLIAGFRGGRTDAVLMRGIDMVMAFPYILLALAIVAVLGPGLINALVAIALVNIPFFARNIRGNTLGIARREFVDAARLSGRSEAGVLFGEVMPNVLPVIVITMSTTVGWMILETAGLSFLGLGAQPPQADLGSMLGEGRKVLFNAPHVSIVPGVMILIVVMAINLLGDGIRDVLDPRLRSGSLMRPLARTAVQRTTVPAGNNDNALLDLQGLRTEFKLGKTSYRAAIDIDLSLAPGECVGLVGESGSGKSVTAMSVMGLVPSPPGAITGGAARLAGEDLFGVDDKRLRQLRAGAVAHVFQDPLSSLHPLYPVGKQLTEAILAHGQRRGADARAHALAMLELVRLPNPAERMKAYPHELSGGMRQRVCIAMALANNPQVLIADEPTTALDVTVQAQILALMNRLRHEREAAILFITHDFGVVSAICDRVAVMYAGRIVETGTTQEILEAPRHPYTARLIACVPVLGQPQRELHAIDGRPPAVDELPDGCAFAERCERVHESCRSGDIALRSLDTSQGKRSGSDRAVRCLFPLDEAAPAKPATPSEARP